MENPTSSDTESISSDLAETRAPIILDLGEHKPKAIKRLTRGEGKLLHEINTTIDELKTTGVISQLAQPVIVIVREKITPKTLFPMLNL
jgi:hypothetical protein